MGLGDDGGSGGDQRHRLDDHRDPGGCPRRGGVKSRHPGRGSVSAGAAAPAPSRRCGARPPSASSRPATDSSWPGSAPSPCSQSTWCSAPPGGSWTRRRPRAPPRTPLSAPRFTCAAPAATRPTSGHSCCRRSPPLASPRPACGPPERATTPPACAPPSPSKATRAKPRLFATLDRLVGLVPPVRLAKDPSGIQEQTGRTVTVGPLGAKCRDEVRRAVYSSAGCRHRSCASSPVRLRLTFDWKSDGTSAPPLARELQPQLAPPGGAPAQAGELNI
jgi:hypothetical protein